MSTLQGLATPTVEINDRVIEIKPNSLSFKGGSGDVNVRHQTAGGGAGTQVVTKDAETRRGMVKFSLISEKTNMELTEEWLELSDPSAAGNVIRLSDIGFTRNFRNMRVTSEPERSIGSDADFEIEFMGEAAS